MRKKIDRSIKTNIIFFWLLYITGPLQGEGRLHSISHPYIFFVTLAVCTYSCNSTSAAGIEVMNITTPSLQINANIFILIDILELLQANPDSVRCRFGISSLALIAGLKYTWLVKAA